MEGRRSSKSDVNKKVVNEETEEQMNTVPNRPTSLNTATSNTNPQQHIRRYNIDDIHRTPSPMDIQPRLFEAGSIIDPTTFARIEASVLNKFNIRVIKEEEGEDDDDDDDDEINSENKQGLLSEVLNEARDAEIQQLSQLIMTQQPMDDETAQFIIQKLDLVLNNTKTITEHPYPPVNQTGVVEDHDRPYADYGHLDREIIAEECGFNLQPSPAAANQPPIRLHAKSFAITSWTNVSQDLVMKEIKDEFGIKNIQYICIGEEMGELNHQRHLHIQIIFKGTIDRRKPFLDEITQTRCNYQVTQNDLAWNEYIKKGGNFIEFNEFKSTSARGSKEWPSPSSSSTSSRATSKGVAAAAAAAVPVGSATTFSRPLPLASRITTRRTTTVRAQAEEKRKHEEDTVIQALKLAETSIDNAMDLMRHSMPVKFVHHTSWYLTSFKYVHLRAQREADRRGDNVDKEYVWPHSFPDCTPKLREAMNQWIQNNFFRAKRAKCLILIGPPGTGKTSFALSLPGHINYFQERWNLDKWNNYARYSVYDDIPWDDFSKLNFPSKKNLLTQKWKKINATDKYRGSIEINVRQPAIVLLNPEDAGSLLKQPIPIEQQKMAEYWEKRAFIYVMGPDEYFYKQRHKVKTNADDSHVSSSSNSSMSTNEERMGGQYEFDEMIKRYQEKHSK